MGPDGSNFFGYGKTMSNPTQTEPKGGPLPGLLRPPIVFLAAILSGIALNRAWSLPFMPSTFGLLGPLVSLCAALLFLLSLREFRAAGTSVRGSVRSTRIVKTGPYRFTRNPIYLAFILFVGDCQCGGIICGCWSCWFLRWGSSG